MNVIKNPPVITKRTIDRIIAGVFILLMLSALVGSLYFFFQTRQMEKTVINTYELNGISYICEHTKGSMECWQTDDPDIGFGRIE